MLLYKAYNLFVYLFSVIFLIVKSDFLIRNTHKIWLKQELFAVILKITVLTTGSFFIQNTFNLFFV
jgi:hypothetical protein